MEIHCIFHPFKFQILKSQNYRIDKSLFDPRPIEIKSFEIGPLMFGMDFKKATN